jgi:hypothetical protein
LKEAIMVRALDTLLFRVRPRRPATPAGARPRRAAPPALLEANRFERDPAARRWRAPAHWCL